MRSHSIKAMCSTNKKRLPIVFQDGEMRFVYDDALAGLLKGGEFTVRRASHVEPDGEGKWNADMSPVAQKCVKCLEIKPLEAFAVRKDSGRRRRECKTCHSKVTVNWRRQRYATDPEFHKRRKTENAKAAADRRWRFRMKALQVYSKSDIPFCACCGTVEIDFLTLDHINGGGRRHQDELEAAGYTRGSGIFKWLADKNYPIGFRVLCFNCNCARGIYGRCPHEGEQKPSFKGFTTREAALEAERRWLECNYLHTKE